ncbi:helix-turn-helix transcriptional regulator [Acidocella aromatica]|uniref:Putative DNA-binding transcriptional regulator AlpA n=1 Tax=Acidocella aromatica TaxID=1303579 RepID=A0A840VI77_9PROT|nr:putative DNA-binding transcriptional regulator AlpA [Acidocella aromatica]
METDMAEKNAAAQSGIATIAAGPETARLLTPREAAERLGATVEALERWRGRGGGPAFVKLSAKFVRYRLEDLDAFVQACRRESTAG